MISGFVNGVEVQNVGGGNSYLTLHQNSLAGNSVGLTNAPSPAPLIDAELNQVRAAIASGGGILEGWRQVMNNDGHADQRHGAASGNFAAR
jgi:hypothetical protein